MHNKVGTCTEIIPKMIQTPVYQTNRFGIVADEAHVIPKHDCKFICVSLFDYKSPV